MKRLARMHVAYFSVVATLLGLASASPVLACLNEIGRSAVGEPIYVEGLTADEFMTQLNTHKDKKYWSSVLSELEGVGDNSDRGDMNNKAVALLHLGRIREGIAILQRLEREMPGLYYTATNLGTAYELNGENAKALEWIKEGINRNDTSHNGSEWLHVKILEAKLALEKDPNWLASNTVLGINRLPNEVLSGSPVVLDHRGQQKDVKQIQAALIYQLHERLEFIKPPEAVVANLLFDLSRILSITENDFHGAAVWTFAETYGSDQMPWSPHTSTIPAVVIPPSDFTTEYLVGGASAVLLAFVVTVLLLLRRKRKLN